MDSRPVPPYSPRRPPDLVDFNEIESPPTSLPPVYSPSTVPEYSVIDPRLINRVTAAHILAMLHREEYDLEKICPRHGFHRELTPEELNEVARVIVLEFRLLGTTRLACGAQIHQNDDEEMEDTPAPVSEERAERRPRYGSPPPFRGDPNPPNLDEEDKEYEMEEDSGYNSEGEAEPMSQ
jgi:hypothetical protein